jgi:hypothetical protein
MTRLHYWLLAACLVLAATPVRAFTPQTIVIDGVNDFDPSNLLQDDGLDTQPNCSPPAYPLDLGKVYATNDASFLYVGIEMARTCFCDMNLGLAIDVNTPAGGTTDAFSRAIAWTTLANKPDFYLYDVTPTNCNSFNYEVLYKWNTGTTAWDNISTQVNPSWGSGSNGLGIGDGNEFKEIKLPLSVLGLTTGSVIHVEAWVTQEGSTKGPMDALCSDAVQLSTPTSTTWDVATPVEMACMLSYTVQNAVDAVPPTVVSAVAVDFQVLLDKTFALTTNKIDVIFSEPVNETTAETVGNYAFSGPVVRSVTSAVRDPQATNVVRLTLNNGIGAAASFFDITVTGVQDLASSPNTIVANGNTNVGSFFIQNVTFNADVTLPQECLGWAVDDTVQVLGNFTPLGFSLCDKAFMFDDEPDGIYTLDVPFALPKDRNTGLAEQQLEWKLNRNCSEYEPFGGNRQYLLSSTNGAGVTIDVAWGNQSPDDYLDQAVRVVFQVDASPWAPTGSDVITLLGDVAPLSFTQPGLPMLDNGVAPDVAAGDGIYTASAVFPVCAYKNVGWKVDYNGVYECATQGNRGFRIDEATYDATGNPQILPARRIDRCTVTDKAIRVVFRVDMTPAAPAPTGGSTIGIASNSAPLGQPPLPPASVMADNGVAPDAVAGDKVYTAEVTFPDSTALDTYYKFWYDAAANGGYECAGFGDRKLFLNDLTFSVGNPILLPIYRWDYCASDLVAVSPGPSVTGGGVEFAVLRQSVPNPISSKTNIHFDLKRGGRVSLTVYDITGRQVARLLDRNLAPGPQSIVWDGRDAAGVRLGSGVYVYELASGADRISRRLVLTR